MLDEEKIKKKALRYKTHLPVLNFVLENYKPKQIMEIGMGDNSTKVFLDYDFEELTSVETDKEWIDRCDNIFVKKDNHKIIHCSDDAPEQFITEGLDLGFVDGRPPLKRGVCVNILLEKNADIIIFHDAEPRFRSGYGYNNLKIKDGYQLFFYNQKDPWTGLVMKNELVTDELKKFMS